MRPVEKGDSPYENISRYQDAEPYLRKRLGRYCSFCEMRVNNALAVEHKESKNSGGSLTDWDNLLLCCTYCNSRKLEKIKKGQALSVAEHALETWLYCRDSAFRKLQIVNIADQAKESEFFSIWMMVFKEEEEVKKALMKAFPGTSQKCFDANGEPVELNNDIF